MLDIRKLRSFNWDKADDSNPLDASLVGIVLKQNGLTLTQDVGVNPFIVSVIRMD